MKTLRAELLLAIQLALALALAFVCVCATATTPRSVVTKEDLSMLMASGATPHQGKNPQVDWQLFVMDDASGQLQSITGFGAAWTDATVTVFDVLAPEAQETLLGELFTAEGEGIGLRLMRHTIGQSDLTPKSLGEWSFDGNNGTADPNLAHFDLTEPGTRMAGWISRMLNRSSGNMTLLGSVWSPPQWMKSGNSLSRNYADSWVQYMVKYLAAYKALGVHVDAITLQNEPLHSADPAWTMFMDSTTAASLTNKLDAALAANGLQTDVWAYDHNTDHPEYPQYVVDHSNVSTVAWHCYSGNWKALSAFQKANPHIKQYMTECWLHLATGETFFDLPGFLSGPLRNFASGALAWTLGGSSDYDVSWPGGCGPCSGIIQVNQTSKSYTKTQDFYTLGQYSKFVDAGAVYLNSTGSWDYPDGTGVDASAFLNPDGSRILVIANKIKNDLTVQATFTSIGAWSAVVPARSVTTWSLPPP